MDTPREALRFYEAAFGATVLHYVGEGDDIVAQLGVGDAAFWVAPTSSTMKRLIPRALDGAATSRTLLVVEDPDSIVGKSVAAGATRTSGADEHGWRLGRIVDLFGHEETSGPAAATLAAPDAVPGTHGTSGGGGGSSLTVAAAARGTAVGSPQGVGPVSRAGARGGA